MSTVDKKKRDKRKFFLFFLLPALLLLLGINFFTGLFIKKSAPETKSQPLTATTIDVNNSFMDSMSKSDIYSDAANQEKRAQEGKAVFDELGNISTDMSSQNITGSSPENLQARLKNEVAQPTFGEPEIPVYENRRPARKNNYGGGGGLEDGNGFGTASFNGGGGASEKDNGFNSVVLFDGTKKDDGGNYNQYGGNDVASQLQTNDISVIAEVSGTQKVINGGTIKLLLKEGFRVNGAEVAAGTVLSGIARFSESRIDVDVRSINVKNKISYVRLKAFDMDGIEGIAIKEKDLAKVGRNAINDEMWRIENGIESKVPGVGGQIAGGVVRAFTRNKREKNETLSVPGGYQIILKN